MSEPCLDQESQDCPPFAGWSVVAVAVAAAIVAAFSATRYGYYYDELYFIAAGKRPSFSYADQGPLVPLLAMSIDRLDPGSFAALRIPAVCAALVVIVTSGAIARELGGGRIAQTLAAIACATAFCVLGEASALSTNGIDTAAWALLSWLVVRWVRTRQDRLLLMAGVLTVLALQVKWLVPAFWIAVLIAVGCCGPRELLRRPALWYSALAVALTAVPMLVWQARHGWPQVGMGAVIRGQTSALYGPWSFLARVVEMCGVLGAVLLLIGLWRLWLSPHLRRFRFLGLAFVLVVTAFAVPGGRVEYGAGMYAAVIAAGAVELAERSRWWLIATSPVVVASIAVFVMWATPWRSPSHLAPATDFASGVRGQAYGEFGWSELRSTVSGAYRALPPETRRHAVIVAEHYPQASALDYDRSAAGLPAVFSPRRGFGYFGSPPETAETVLWIGGNAAELHERFASVAPVAVFGVPLGMPGVTRDITIWKCSGPRQPWSSMWPKLRTL